MTCSRRTTTRRAAVALGGLLAVCALAAPTASATHSGVPNDGMDPALYATELPEGVVEHGVIDFRISGAPSALHTRTAYWASSTRWRSVTTDVPTGLLMNEAFGTERQTTWFTLRRPATPPPGAKPSDGPFWTDEPPSVRTSQIRSTPPFAGHAAGYNRKLVENGTLVPAGPATVAGVAGTRYVGSPTPPPPAPGAKSLLDVPGASMEMVLETGTFAPLVRQYAVERNGSWGRFVQREELVLRERSTDDAGLNARLSPAAYARATRAWNAKVRTAKAKAKARTPRTPRRG